jgi:lipopolysaccharide/colanic/teichoic acid biosynthesis glycosyltransferase
MWRRYSIGPKFKKQKAALKIEQELIKEKSIKEGPVYKIADDPRVTPVGHFIRRWSIDELPQFINVFKGDMSLVGPRPHQPREVANYLPHHRRVLAIKPGITGLAQISGRSDLDFEDEVRLDAWYIENWSPALDLYILIKTPMAVINKKGAY